MARVFHVDLSQKVLMYLLRNWKRYIVAVCLQLNASRHLRLGRGLGLGTFSYSDNSTVLQNINAYESRCSIQIEFPL